MKYKNRTQYTRLEIVKYYRNQSNTGIIVIYKISSNLRVPLELHWWFLYLFRRLTCRPDSCKQWNETNGYRCMYMEAQCSVKTLSLWSVGFSCFYFRRLVTSSPCPLPPRVISHLTANSEKKKACFNKTVSSNKATLLWKLWQLLVTKGLLAMWFTNYREREHEVVPTDQSVHLVL